MITELELIPKEFWSALDACPEDMTLRSAIVDRLLELGEEDAAEAIRWSIVKGVTPHNNGSWAKIAPNVFFKIYLHIADPLAFSSCESPANKPFLISKSFRRLIKKWLLATPEQRKFLWEWNPK